MVRLGKTYGNLMVDLKAGNRKLLARSLRILESAAGLTSADADAALREAGGDVRVAIVAARLGVDAREARRRLHDAGGRVRAALET
jgi:N-acetylmuramic acid 6-phosphate etherase